MSPRDETFVTCLLVAAFFFLGFLGKSDADPLYRRLMMEDLLRTSSTAGGFANDPSRGIDVVAARQNLHRALTYAFSRRDGAPLTTRDIQQVHAILNQGDRSARPGEWRSATGSARIDGVSGVRYPAPADVGRRLESGILDKALREASRPGMEPRAAIRTAASVYTEIVRTHYFDNGNGRTGRILSDMVLMRQGLPPASLVHRNDLMLDLTRPVSHLERHAGEAIRQGVERSRTRLAAGSVRPLAAPGATSATFASSLRGGIIGAVIGLLPAAGQLLSGKGAGEALRSALPVLAAVAAGVAFAPLGVVAATLAAVTAGELAGMGSTSMREMLGGIAGGSLATVMLRSMLMASMPWSIGASLVISGAVVMGRMLMREGGLAASAPARSRILDVPMGAAPTP